MTYEDPRSIREQMRALFAEYISSPRWSTLRERVIERDAGRCNDCGEQIGEEGVCHHTHYANWATGGPAEVRDCVLLCPKYHNTRHRRKSSHPHFVEVPFFAKQGAGDALSFKEETALFEKIRRRRPLEGSQEGKPPYGQ
ncbi:MAG: HNH endonuclease [Planctomycetota bacterium]|jgi:hypothetical protein